MNPERVEALQSYLRSEIRALQPYEAEAAGPLIRLDANESPWDVPPALKEEILQGFMNLSWNRYPDPQATELRKALARRDGVTPDQVVLGNGSDEIIRDLLGAYGGPGTRTLFPSPTFSMYRLLTLASGGTPVGIRLKEWDLDSEAFLAELDSSASRLVFLASPNNPTGNRFSAEAIEAILRRTDRLVVIDEAYRLFSGESWLPRLAEYPNLAILNTFSKSMSLAGLRIGYLAAHPEVIQSVHRVRLPYNLDLLAQHAALKVLEYPELWEEQARQVTGERERLSQALSKLSGIKVYPSHANFLFIRVPDAPALKSALAAGGIAVRGFSGGEGLTDCLRITVGRPEENDRLLQLCQSNLNPQPR